MTYISKHRLNLFLALSMGIIALVFFAAPAAAAENVCPYDSTQATCDCPTWGPGVTCIEPQLYAQGSCYTDPRPCAVNEVMNCIQGDCVCDTANYPCSSCSAPQTTVSEVCDHRDTDFSDCADNSRYSNSCGAWECPANTTLCNSPAPGRCVTNRTCPEGLTWNVCSDTCTTPYVLREPDPSISPQSANPKISGSFTLTNGDMNVAWGDLYIANGKAVRVDGSGITQVNFGNWGSGGTGVKMNVLGYVDATKTISASGFSTIDTAAPVNTIETGTLCLGTDCISDWSTVIPTGATNQTLRHNGSDWVASSNLVNTDSRVGINTATPGYTLDVNGDTNIGGALGVNGMPPTAGYGISARGSVTGGYFTNSVNGVYSYLAYEQPGNYGLFTNGSIYATGNLFSYGYTYLGNNQEADQILIRSTKMRVLDDIDIRDYSDTYTLMRLVTPNGDSANARVGIKTETPAYDLDVNGVIGSNELCLGGDCVSSWGEVNPAGSPNDIAFWDASGNLRAIDVFSYDSSVHHLGIGTHSPDFPIDIMRRESMFQFEPLVIRLADAYRLTNQFTGIRLDRDSSGSGLTQRWFIGMDDDHQLSPTIDDFLILRNGTDVDFLIDRNTGNVGIGTHSPEAAYKLDVSGTIRATGLRMSTGASTGRVLTSDVFGNATWQNVPSAPPSGSAGGDLAGTYPNPTIKADAVELGTDTTGNYVSALGAGTGISVTGSPGEGWTPTVAVNQGSLSLNSIGGSLTLGAKTTGNYVASLIAGSGISITGGSGEGSTPTISANVTHPWTESGSNVYRSSGNVGIGTSSPASKLDVVGNTNISGSLTVASNALHVVPSATRDQVGIGINSGLQGQLHINVGDDGVNQIAFTNTDTGSAWGDGARIGLNAVEALTIANLESGKGISLSTDNQVIIGNSGDNTVYVDTTGHKVGIGTATPTYALDVAGELGVDMYVRHNDDTNTYAYFVDDRFSVVAGGYEMFKVSTAAGSVGATIMTNSAPIVLMTATNTGVFLDGAGRVGINNPFPSYTLDVTGTTRLSSTTYINGTAYLQGNVRFGNSSGDAIYSYASTWTPYNNLSIDGGTLYIDQLNNRIGIGTTVPTYALDVAGDVGFDFKINHNNDTNTYAYFTDDRFSVVAGGYEMFKVSRAAGSLGATIMTGGNPLHLSTGTEQGVFLNGAGLVGVNDSSPSYTLDVSGTLRTTDNAAFGGAFYSNTYGINAQGSTMGGRFYDEDGTSYAYVAYGSWGFYTNASAAKLGGGSWSVYSDERVKTGIVPFEGGLDLVEKMNPVSFTYNGLAGTREGEEGIGFVAQDMVDVAPWMLETMPAKLRPEDAEATDVYYLNPSSLPFINLNAIKDLREMFDGLDAEREFGLNAEVDELRQENQELRNRVELLEQAFGMND